jgi:hypothetical protein
VREVDAYELRLKKKNKRMNEQARGEKTRKERFFPVSHKLVAFLLAYLYSFLFLFSALRRSYKILLRQKHR